MTLRELFDYYFYVFYLIILSTGEKNSPQINTYIGIAAMLGFNILSILFFLGILVTGMTAVGIFVGLVIVSYGMYIHKNRYQKIVERYTYKDPYPVYGKIVVVTYYIITIGLLTLAANVIRNGYF